MNPLEERLNRLETRVTRYRNFNVLLCLLMATVVTVAAKDGVSELRAKSIPASDSVPEGDVPIPEMLGSGVDAVMQRQVRSAAKLAEQTQGVIRATGLEIVNSDGQPVVELWPSTAGGGLIFVNSAEDKNLVYIGSSASNGDGLVHINSNRERNLIGLGSNPETRDGLIGIRNRNEERMISLNTSEKNGWIRIDKTGNENLAYIGANTQDNGLLSLSNKSGKGLVSMYADEAAGNLQIRNNNDKMIAYLGWSSEGQGVLKINSKTGTELITAGSNVEDDGLLRVSNRYGTLGFFAVSTELHGYVGIQDNQERLLADLTATAGGDGLMRTLSRQGITTWSSASVQRTTGSTSLRGDMDDDGDIDGDDFLIFSENFGKK